MANWDNIKTKVSHTAKKTVKKAGEIADITSLHIKLKSRQSKAKDRFEQLGKLTYKQLKTGVSQAEDIASVITEIDVLRVEIKELKIKIEEAKEARKKKDDLDDIPTEEADTEETE